MTNLRADQALDRLLEYSDIKTVLDIGSGTGEHAEVMRAAGKQVTTISLMPPADVIGDFMEWTAETGNFDAIWASHVLEHQVDPGAFLRECRSRLKPGGRLFVTVPPLKHSIVGGHVSLWNAGLLLYQLILAGFDCRTARVGCYGYNISVIAENKPVKLPELHCDAGDIDRLAEWFPLKVYEAFDGRIHFVNWGNETRDETAAIAVPERVAILGLGPSLEAYVDLTKRMGGRAAISDEVWGINAVGDVINCDRIFHMDDVRIQESRAAAKPESNIAQMLKWMRKHPGPIYTSREHPDYPGLVEYPLQDVINSCGMAYFNSTAAYAVAYAVHIGVKQISVFGFDFTYANAHDAEKGRGCVEFHLGIAKARGIEIGFPEASTIMDANAPEHERIYGYDTLSLEMDGGGDQPVTVKFTPKEQWPSSSEIEARYDHSKHPNRLVKQT